MQKRKATKNQIKKERSLKKVKKVIKQKWYLSSKLSKGKVLHHVKPVASRGKTTKKNARVISEKNIKKFIKIEIKKEKK